MTTEITAIWDTFHAELRSFIQHKTRSNADTDDILQDAFIRIIRHRDKVNQSKNLRLYLYGIVQNAINDHFKHRMPVADATGIDGFFTEEEASNLNSTIADCCVKPFVNKLPEHYRDALLITEFQDISQKELAKQLGISYSGAKSRVQRGKEKLRELLLECCPYKTDVYGNIISNEDNRCGCS